MNQLYEYKVYLRTGQTHKAIAHCHDNHDGGFHMHSQDGEIVATFEPNVVGGWAREAMQSSALGIGNGHVLDINRAG